jgi:hypothetical protein
MTIETARSGTLVRAKCTLWYRNCEPSIPHIRQAIDKELRTQSTHCGEKRRGGYFAEIAIGGPSNWICTSRVSPPMRYRVGDEMPI